jgi:hypothetical protein
MYNSVMTPLNLDSLIEAESLSLDTLHSKTSLAFLLKSTGTYLKSVIAKVVRWLRTPSVLTLHVPKFLLEKTVFSTLNSLLMNLTVISSKLVSASSTLRMEMILK